MLYRMILISFFLFTTRTIANENNIKIVTVADFTSMIDTLGLQFELPEGYKEIQVKNNRDLQYCFAIAHSNVDIEVRYSIWGLQAEFKVFERCKKDTNCIGTDPDKYGLARAKANILNMTGGQDLSLGMYDKKAVKDEFGADIGGCAYLPFNCSFADGFKYGMMVFLHKDGVADVIITFMSNDKVALSLAMKKTFHALRFK